LQRPIIVCLDIAQEIATALRAASARRGLEVSTDPATAASSGAPIVAGVLPAESTTRPTHFERLATLRRALRGAPLIALVDPRSTQRQGLAAAGFHATIQTAAPYAAPAERCVQSAQAARRAVDLDLVGGSSAMARLREELLLAASAPSHALLLGETGTGKGVAARALHALSPRRDAPFETVDCTALSPTLVESELFGHERGAFTGAHERRRGRLERAANGTLFLDEIGELELGLQAKLLRALEERRFDRLGGHEPLGFAARVVAATNRNLEAEVRNGRFRRDLFYRLDVLRVRLPRLDERLDDLPVLVDHLLLRAARRLEREPLRASRALLEQLREREWPGNVRELANRLEAMAVRAIGDELGVTDLPATTETREPRPASERHQLAELLRECGGNVARVARRLGRPRSTVRYRIARYDLLHLIPRD